jgi:hypothetical protein
VAEHSTAMPSDTWPMNKKLPPGPREALGMLAASLRCRIESVMEDHEIGTLPGLIRGELATADRGPAYFRPGVIVTKLQITEAGRQANCGRKKPHRCRAGPSWC